jgi:hypothetical protein
MESDSSKQRIGTEETLLVRIVDEVACATNTNPLELPTLHDFVDVEALERLHRTSGESLSTTFRYHGCTVVVDSGGAVSVSPATNERE